MRVVQARHLGIRNRTFMRGTAKALSHVSCGWPLLGRKRWKGRRGMKKKKKDINSTCTRRPRIFPISGKRDTRKIHKKHIFRSPHAFITNAFLWDHGKFGPYTRIMS